MNSKVNGRASLSDALRKRLNTSDTHLLAAYTLLFALFFTAVFSPFLLYGRAFLLLLNGHSQHIPSLTYFRSWIKTIVQNLSNGKLEIPFWSMWVGFGENSLSNGIVFRFFYLLSLLFKPDSLVPFLTLRLILRLYLAGLAYLAFGRTRVKDRWALLLGCMIYLFCGFVLSFGPRYSYFVSMMIELPLLLLGVDRIFEKKWSWLFILTVFAEAFCGFYFLFMITIPAVIYALFHFFELTPTKRRDFGGFGRIFARHVVQYALGVCLAAAGLLPVIFKYLESSRVSVDSGLSFLHWDGLIYMDYIRGIVDSHQVAYRGYLALPAVALIGTFYLLYRRKKRDRLFLWQILLYHLAFLIPLLTMVFNGMGGRMLRWTYMLSFWTSLGTAYVIRYLQKDDGRGFRFSVIAMGVYALLYIIASIWAVEDISLSIVLALLGVGVFYATVLSPWSRRRQRLARILLFAWLLVELTAKSYEMHAPQYDNVISAYTDASRAMATSNDNASDALEMTSDDGLFRTDVITVPHSQRLIQSNYGLRNQINGVSSFYSLCYSGISAYSLGLGNAHQISNHTIMDLDQRTVLDALAGVKYVTAFEDGLDRVPYGYERMDAREKQLSDGTVTTEYLYRNRYPLSLSYAYTARITPEAYDALPPNRKEQAMLQGVVLEGCESLQEAALSFDDTVLADTDAFLSAFEQKAAEDDSLELRDGSLIVKKKNYTFDLPIEKVEGEIYLQFRGLDYRSFNINAEEADALANGNATRLEIMNARRSARQWTAVENSTITVSTGLLSDEGKPCGPEDHHYMGTQDMLFNLGYGETGKKLRIKFASPGQYRFDSLELICQPMDRYAEKIAPLQANQALSTVIDGNRITVEYDLDQDAFACLAVPYSLDWSVTVDGKRAELIRANSMYMGVMLTKGRHQIVYTCTMKGFWLGTAISLITLAALICIAIIRRKRKRPAQAQVPAPSVR